jgi:hypothetical protein
MPGNMSTSIPRAAKISAARGLKSSEIKTFGMITPVAIYREASRSRE